MPKRPPKEYAFGAGLPYPAIWRFIRRNAHELFGLAYCAGLAIFCLFYTDNLFVWATGAGYAVGAACAGFWVCAIFDNEYDRPVRMLSSTGNIDTRSYRVYGELNDTKPPVELDPILNAERN